ncbi:unnamed protein product, partial [Iphiclides podalirius]
MFLRFFIKYRLLFLASTRSKNQNFSKDGHRRKHASCPFEQGIIGREVPPIAYRMRPLSQLHLQSTLRRAPSMKKFLIFLVLMVAVCYAAPTEPEAEPEAPPAEGADAIPVPMQGPLADLCKYPLTLVPFLKDNLNNPIVEAIIKKLCPF